MKNLLLAVLLAALSFSSVLAQQPIKRDKNGNFYEVRAKSDSMTNKTFTDSKGKLYRVWATPRGKFYCNVLSKKGTSYKRYLN